MGKIDLLWNESPEYKTALLTWLRRVGFSRDLRNDGWPMVHNINGNDKEFKYSPEFRNARLAFRRRVNGSPDTETT